MPRMQSVPTRSPVSVMGLNGEVEELPLKTLAALTVSLAVTLQYSKGNAAWRGGQAGERGGTMTAAPAPTTAQVPRAAHAMCAPSLPTLQLPTEKLPLLLTVVAPGVRVTVVVAGVMQLRVAATVPGASGRAAYCMHGGWE